MLQLAQEPTPLWLPTAMLLPPLRLLRPGASDMRSKWAASSSILSNMPGSVSLTVGGEERRRRSMSGTAKGWLQAWGRAGG